MNPYVVSRISRIGANANAPMLLPHNAMPCANDQFLVKYSGRIRSDALKQRLSPIANSTPKVKYRYGMLGMNDDVNSPRPYNNAPVNMVLRKPNFRQTLNVAGVSMYVSAKEIEPVQAIERFNMIMNLKKSKAKLPPYLLKDSFIFNTVDTLCRWSSVFM